MQQPVFKQAASDSARGMRAAAVALACALAGASPAAGRASAPALSSSSAEIQRSHAAVAELGWTLEHDLRQGIAPPSSAPAAEADDVLSDARAFYRRLRSQPVGLTSAEEGENLGPVSIHPARASPLLLDRALSYRGTPYRWGGANRQGLDCSGLVLRALADLGLRAPHSAALLFGLGQPVETSGLLPGDLVFFRNTYKPGISHVGIVERGSRFVHASSAAGQVTTGDLGRPYFRARYAGARRIAADYSNRPAPEANAQPENMIAASLRLGLPDLPD